MNWDFFSFLANPWFVVPWYAVGLLGAIWVVRDQTRVNVHLPTALKWGFPILVFFFSIIGLGLYLGTARPPHVGQLQGEAKKAAFKEYAKSPFRKVTGSVIHCVAGDGLGIVTAMIIARLIGMNFWQELSRGYSVECSWHSHWRGERNVRPAGQAQPRWTP